MTGMFRYESYSKAAIRGTHCGWCERPFEDNEAVYKGDIAKDGIGQGNSIFNLLGYGPMCESCAHDRYDGYRGTFKQFRLVGNCQVCGRPVMAKRQLRHITCCENCRQKIYRPSKKIHITYATCEGCGESFHTKRTDSKYCSSKCRQAAYRKKEEARSK